MKFKRILIVLLFVALSSNLYASDTGLKIDENGNVGIGTATPESKLEVNGDLKINGKIKRGGDYADWYVGGYYSIPTDIRPGQWDKTITNLTTTWETVDLSSRLPRDVKRVKIYIDMTGTTVNNGRILLWSRPYGSTANTFLRCGKILIQKNASGASRYGLEMEVDVNNGKFQIMEHSETWDIKSVYIALRGFYL